MQLFSALQVATYAAKCGPTMWLKIARDVSSKHALRGVLDIIFGHGKQNIWIWNLKVE